LTEVESISSLSDMRQDDEREGEPAGDGRSKRSAEAMWETAYRVLKHRIIRNELTAGAEINDGAVAAELGISRTPVREAILRLSNEGLVEVVPRRAIRVVPISLADMKDMYQLLTALEVFAVELLAAAHPSEDYVRPLREAVRDLAHAVKIDDRDAWVDADERFHRGLLTLCGNRQIAQVGLSFRDRVLRAHVVALRLRPQPRASVRVHGELVDLIVAGDVAGARRNHLKQRVNAGGEALGSVERAGIMFL
jgi:DNA-binding GntR family transcriptional regulator